MIEESEYSVAIQIPEHIASDMKDPPKAILVKFKSKEEKEYYVKEEFKATHHALKAVRAAFTKEDRQKAFLDLYKARNAFCDKFLREELARLKSITDPAAA